MQLGMQLACALAIAGLGMGLTTPVHADSLTVKTIQGKVQGKTINDGKVKAFLGLPYAAPPVGNLRWKAPESPDSWKGVRDATKKAQDIFGSNLEGATAAQSRLEAENLEQMRAAIAALGKAQTLIADRTDKAIERGLSSMELIEQVKVSAGAVRAAMADFQKVDAGLANRDNNAIPAGPPAAPEGSGPPSSPGP